MTPPMTDEQLEDVIDGVPVIPHDAIEMFRVRIEAMAEQYKDCPVGDVQKLARHLDDAATNIRQLLAQYAHLRSRLAAAERERDEARRISNDYVKVATQRICNTRKLCEAIDRFKRYGTDDSEQALYEAHSALSAVTHPEMAERADLIAERDEARAQVTALSERLAAAARERDEARAKLGDTGWPARVSVLTLERDEARAKLDGKEQLLQLAIKRGNDFADGVTQLSTQVADLTAKRDQAVADLTDVRVRMFEAERQRDVLQARIDEIDAQYNNLLRRAQKDEAEAIAHWLAGQGPGFTKAAADIRSGAHRKGR